MEPLNILFFNEAVKTAVLWSIQNGEDRGDVYFYEVDCVNGNEYPLSQMTKKTFSYNEHEQLAKGGLTRWDM